MSAPKPTPPAEERTPEQVNHDAVRADLDRLRRERAVLRRAPHLAANGPWLADSISFMKTFALVDPDDSTAVDAAITDALGSNPAFAVPTPNTPRRTP